MYNCGATCACLHVMLFVCVLFAGNTLGRLGRVVGNFFGVTEASQHGTAGNIGWEEWTEQRVNEVRFPSLPPSLSLLYVLTHALSNYVCE